MDTLFVYDRLVEAQDICNFKKDIAALSDAVEKGRCVRLYGRRNFGKTSIVKNIVAPTWEQQDPATRVPIYIDLYAAQSLHDISHEFSKAFNTAITRKQSLMEKGFAWLKTIRNMRPTWKPPTESSDFGEFSIKTETGSDVVDFDIILSNIQRLSKTGKFSFLLIMDEFQEIANIRQAEAKLRAGLQELGAATPVIILGSKQHMLEKIFNKPKAPFHAWGTTIELRAIPYEEYFSYMQERFTRAGKTIDSPTSINLQDLMERIPESINRLCDAIAENPEIREITHAGVNQTMSSFLDRSMSIYSAMYAQFSAAERKVLLALARRDRARNVLSASFIQCADGVSKSGVEQIVRRFLDRGTVYQEFTEAGVVEYLLADPLFKFYLRKYKLFYS